LRIFSRGGKRSEKLERVVVGPWLYFTVKYRETEMVY
jgi:hypothetical protein